MKFGEKLLVVALGIWFVLVTCNLVWLNIQPYM